MLDAIEVDCAARIAMANLIGLFLLSLLACCFATPTELGLKFDKRSGHLPTLTLPYGTWQATKYNADVSSPDRIVQKQIDTCADDDIRSIFSKIFALELRRSGS